MASRLCGQLVGTHLGVDSPFGKLVAFGYEDGPSTGLVQCAGCDLAYRFDLLAIDIDGVHDFAAWERGEELRIYSLSQLVPGEFDRIVSHLSAIEAPNWPVWLVRPGAGINQSDQAFDKATASIKGEENRSLVVAARGDLRQSIAYIREMSSGGNIPKDVDWFSLLGFASDRGQLAST